MAELVAATPGWPPSTAGRAPPPASGPSPPRRRPPSWPEPGQRDRRRIAASPAPVARDSGKPMGRRAIGGRRPGARTMPHVAALHASPRRAASEALRARLQGAGKPVEAALARKIPVTLDATLATGTHDRRHSPARTQSPGLSTRRPLHLASTSTSARAASLAASPLAASPWSRSSTPARDGRTGGRESASSRIASWRRGSPTACRCGPGISVGRSARR